MNQEQAQAQAAAAAVAVFSNMGGVIGEVLFKDTEQGCKIMANFTKLPEGKHGFHIHKSGDLRGTGCLGACTHFHKGPETTSHGGPPSSKGERHTGDLGNVIGPSFKKTYLLKDVKVEELYGRTLIVHEDEDDYGLGGFEDSKITGHAGKRIACAIIGRASPCSATAKKTKPATRKNPFFINTV